MGRLFKPGQSGNPNGRPNDPPELKALKHLTKKDMADMGNIVISGDVDELKRIANDPKSTVLKAMIASAAAKIISKGDMASLDILLNRLIGKVKDEVHHMGELSTAPQVIITLPDNGRQAPDTINVTPKQLEEPEDDYGF